MATITARFNSICPKCGEYINAGTEVNYVKGSKATHISCPTVGAKNPAGIILAKFNSTCPKCNKFISVGDRVNWVKGSKATHVTCPTGDVVTPKAPEKTKAPAKTAAPSVELAPYTRGEKWEPCKRASLRDTTGDVRIAKATKYNPWASLREGATGAPVIEGDALIVVKQTAYYENAEDNEDMGDMSGPGWQVTLYMRRATPEEAAPTLEEQRKKLETAQRAQTKAELLKGLADYVRATGTRIKEEEIPNTLPKGVIEVVTMKTSYGGAQELVRVCEDGSVIVWHAGWHDDYRRSMTISYDPELAERVRDVAKMIEGA